MLFANARHNTPKVCAARGLPAAGMEVNPCHDSTTNATKYKKHQFHKLPS